MNLPKLKGIIRERGKTYVQCAAAIDKSVATFNSKMNGRSKFYIDELDELGNFLHMSETEKQETYLS